MHKIAKEEIKEKRISIHIKVTLACGIHDDSRRGKIWGGGNVVGFRIPKDEPKRMK